MLRELSGCFSEDVCMVCSFKKDLTTFIIRHSVLGNDVLVLMGGFYDEVNQI